MKTLNKKLFGMFILFATVAFVGYAVLFGNFHFTNQEVLRLAQEEIPGVVTVVSTKKNILRPSEVIVITDYGRRVRFQVRTSIFGEMIIDEGEVVLIAYK